MEMWLLLAEQALRALRSTLSQQVSVAGGKRWGAVGFQACPTPASHRRQSKSKALIKTIAKQLTIFRRFATYFRLWFESNQNQLPANLRLQKQRVQTVLLLLLRWPNSLLRRNHVTLKV